MIHGFYNIEYSESRNYNRYKYDSNLDNFSIEPVRNLCENFLILNLIWRMKIVSKIVRQFSSLTKSTKKNEKAIFYRWSTFIISNIKKIKFSNADYNFWKVLIIGNFGLQHKMVLRFFFFFDQNIVYYMGSKTKKINKIKKYGT